MKLHFQNRVALFNTVAASIVIALVFAIIYIVVYLTAYRHLDNDIRREKDRVLNVLEYRGDSIEISKLTEWERKENETVEANPVFIQLANNSSNIIFRSANLLHKYFLLSNNKQGETFSNRIINKDHFREGQFPLWSDVGKRIGSISIAISREESHLVLYNLALILIVSYPIVIIGLYFFMLYFVSKAIAPVRNLIKIASGIDDTNINMRMPLPEKEDEIYQLAETINDFLGRVETSMKYQKQFTADASHEMRTPLSAIRGILEVSLRKRREPEQYERSIKEAISQVDRMHVLMEQLLQLARLNAGAVKANLVQVDLVSIVTELEQKWTERFDDKMMTLHRHMPPEVKILCDPFLFEIILENLVGNAIKYGRQGGNIFIGWYENSYSLSVTDDGSGIAAEHLPHLFERFYRTDNSRNSKMPGNGLGLSIVQKMANLLNITITVTSAETKGTSFVLHFGSPSF